jgi:hypothetical protein
MASNNPKVIVIDHLGDAILTLKNPNTPFAVWKEASGAEKAAPESGVDSDGTKRKVVLGDKTLKVDQSDKNQGPHRHHVKRMMSRNRTQTKATWPIHPSRIKCLLDTLSVVQQNFEAN